jgi:hypothetical protein
MGLIYTFRFDDVSVNTDWHKLDQMVAFLRSTFKADQLRLVFGVSPAVFDMRECEKTLDRERTFHSIIHTESDFRVFYQVERVGIPVLLEQYRKEGVEIAGHGMVHVDHRLLSRGAQEMSILMSCSLLKSKVFIPPFHKWNHKTAKICADHGITLVKYDRTWRHLLYHKFDHRNPNYYVHTHDFHYQSFCGQFTAEGLSVRVS